ncbi:DNA topoisomerase 2-beta, partial [Dermatophagoides farinae]
MNDTIDDFDISLQQSAGKIAHNPKRLVLTVEEDAYDAGSMNSLECTLIVAEGDSAHMIVNSGISVVNRNKFGIFPLNGKFINVREANKKQIMGNVDIKCLVEILGLKYNMKYTTEESMKSLRYGRLMIMTDQDPD